MQKVEKLIVGEGVLDLPKPYCKLQIMPKITN